MRDESRFKGNDGKCWNTSAENNGYDLCVVVRDFLRGNGFESLSIAEVLWSEGREGVGEATVFFSHIQLLPIRTALQTLREASKVYAKEMGTNPRFFIDYLGIRQAQKGVAAAREHAPSPKHAERVGQIIGMARSAAVASLGEIEKWFDVCARAAKGGQRAGKLMCGVSARDLILASLAWDWGEAANT